MEPFSGEQGQVNPQSQLQGKPSPQQLNTTEVFKSQHATRRAQLTLRFDTQPFKHIEMLCKHGLQEIQCRMWHFLRRQYKTVRTWDITCRLKGAAPHYCFRFGGFQQYCGVEAAARKRKTNRGEDERGTQWRYQAAQPMSAKEQLCRAASSDCEYYRMFSLKIKAQNVLTSKNVLS